ncbi:MAG: hypothetical protein JST47_10130 [Bacteroidetes bacterium]|nr:hypothetical protein [Bacteroidota bacterium]
MDDLFRKAAENYHLDTKKASNWESVQAAIDSTAVTGNKKKKRRFLFLWLLVLPFACIIGYSLFQDKTNVSYSKEIYNSHNPNRNYKDKTSVSPKREVPGIVVGQNNKKSQPIADSGNHLNKTSLSLFTGRPTKFLERKSAGNGTAQPGDNAILINTKGLPGLTAANNKTGNVHVTEEISNRSNYESNDINSSKIFTGKLASVNQNCPGAISEALFSNMKQAQLAKIKTNKTVTGNDNTGTNFKKGSFFYLGTNLGFDFSFVKSQRTSNAGYGVGLLLGYHINKKLNIEAGAVFEKKYYYSNGRYFDKRSISSLQYVNVLSVNGNCNMVDVPVNLRYNFLLHKKSEWFAIAGMSSYFMTKEYYDYNYEYNGAYGEKGYTYHNSSINWFSVFNISVGYEHNLGRAFLWRAGPYLKLPVSGIGLGKLSLNSTGLYAGIIKRIN